MSPAAPRSESGESGQAEPDPGYLAAAQQGIHRIELDTPFAVGTVNVYLIEDDPLTLIDVGPNSQTTLDELSAGLGALGHRIEDLGLIVITHQHLDHLGLLEPLTSRCSAEVAAFGPLSAYLDDFLASVVADDDFALAIMRRHGVPEDVATTLRAVAGSFHSFGSGAPLSVALHDGDTITLRDRTLSVHHRPGHSPSDLMFADGPRRIGLSGDHLLARISSNAVVTRPLTGPELDVAAGERPHPLAEYNAALRATRAMDLSLILGGHGPTMTDHVQLIDDRLRAQDRRARKIIQLLTEGPLTAYGLSRRMWGNVAVTQAFLTVSEVLDHLDLLIADGRVIELLDGAVTRFSLA